MEKKNDADILLDLIKFNKKKHNIIMDMASLEARGNLGKKYADDIKSYEVVNWYIDKELRKYTPDKKRELLEKLVSINPSIGGYLDFMDTIQNINNIIHMQKTVTNLNGSTIYFYHGENNHEIAKNIIKEMFGINTKETKTEENVDAINSYMTYDYVNMLLSVIMNDIKLVDSLSTKEALLKLKYNLIYVSEELECRALNTKFLIPDKPSLVNEVMINTANITKDEYLRKCDIVFSRHLENIILMALDRVYKNNLKRIHYLDHLSIKTYANLITDKELCKYLVLEPTDDMEPNIKLSTTLINTDLITGSNVDVTDRKTLRI